VIIVVAAILAVLTVPLSGKSLAPLAQLTLRHAWLVWLSIGTQLLITVIPDFPETAGQVLHLLTFASAAAFMWVNRRIPGTVVIAVGAGLNLAAIGANGGTMPASSWAWHTAGFDALTNGFENSNVAASARLAWLGDVFAVPHGWPLANVFSIGDVIVVIGLGYFAHAACRSDSRSGGEQRGEQLGRRSRDRGAASSVVQHDQVAAVQVDNVGASLATDHH
jgi:hypothetical protein